MTTICTIDKITKEYGDRRVLDGISFMVNDGDRMGIVGDNGSGKTTLMKILNREIEADSGQVVWHAKGMRVGYLRQSVDQSLEGRDVLSGGERTKRALIEIWNQAPQVLFLDEPTNHMDQAGVAWLIREIRRFQGTLVAISHDRYFLDQIADRIVEIDGGKGEAYKGNYTAYRQIKEGRMESDRHLYRVQEKERKRIEEEIRHLRSWSAKGHRESTKKEGLKEKYRTRAKKKDKRVKAQLNRLEKMKAEGLKKPREEQTISFDFVAAPLGGKRVIEAREMTMGYGGEILFDRSSFTILSGERIGLVGPNGCGKTTWIRNLIKDLPLIQGDLIVSPAAKMAILHQDVLDLEEDKSVLEIFGIHDRTRRGKLQSLLTNMGFSKAMMNQRVGDLSLGERTRLKVAEMIVMDNNLLVLDEPTNHLDLHSREMLEQTLETYGGTLLVVSHDRYFLEKVCSKLLVFDAKRITKVEMTYGEYMQKAEMGRDKPEESQEEKMRIETQLTEILSRLSLEKPGSKAYMELDESYGSLLKKKRELT